MILLFYYKIYRLNDSSFEGKIDIESKNDPWIIIFTSDIYPSCQQANTEFYKSYEVGRFFGNYGIAFINETKNKIYELKLTKIPSLVVFNERGINIFNGTLTSHEILLFISKLYGESIDIIEDDWIESDDNKILLFTKKFSPELLFSSSYGAFRKFNLTFGWTRDSSIIKQYNKYYPDNIITLPSVLLLKQDKTLIYNIQNNNLKDFFDTLTSFFAIQLSDNDELINTDL